jgi:DNA-binding NtrC family response regulator
MMNIHLLIVDHDERFLSTAKALMEKEGIYTKTAFSGAESLRILSTSPIDVVILNVEMPGMGGMEILFKIKQRQPLVEVIMMTDHASVASAVEGLKNGAFDYIMRPCKIPAVLGKIQQACKKKIFAEEKIRKSKMDRIISHPMALFDNGSED